MDLVGFSYTGAEPPLESGYVPLAELTVVLGPNDAGKTRLLRELEGSLDGEQGRPGVVLFCSCSDAELRFVVGHATADLVGPDEGGYDALVRERAGSAESPNRITRIPSLSGLGVWRPSAFESWELSPAGDPCEALLELLHAELPDPSAAWERVLTELAESRLLAFEPSWRAGVWDVYWCLSPLEEQSPELRNELLATGLQHLKDEPATGFLAQAAEREQPTWHRRVGRAPTLVAPIGETSLPLLPRPVTVPTGFDRIAWDIEGAVARMVAHSRWARSDYLKELESAIGPAQRSDDEAWIEEEGTTTLIHEDALTACQLIGATATGLLPSFVGDRYAVKLEINPISRWHADGRLHLLLVERAGDHELPIEAVADGHRIWLQLALLEAVDSLENKRIELEVALEYWMDDEVALDEAADVEDSRYDELERERDEQKALYEEGLAAFHAAAPLTPPSHPDFLAWAFEHFNPRGVKYEQRALLDVARQRMYFIDEPEQHLHPRVQRQSARWLADAVSERRSQAVVTTHAVSFLNLRDDAQLVYVRRQAGGRAAVEPIGSEALKHTTEVALELGLDRGELMTLVNVFLFVEGRADQTVLEALFERELHVSGIAVVPIHGVSRAKGIADAEALLRFTTARAAVWLDNVAPATVEKLKTDAEYAAAARADKDQPAEVRSLADLLLTARKLGVEVEPLPHPGKDIVDLLDAGVLYDLHGFPGHQQAMAAWQAEKARSGVRRKDFYRTQYGIDDVESYRRAAEAMARRGAVPPALQEVIDRCELLAL